MLFTLVRHGESTANIQQLWSGHTNHPLTSLGLRQAELLAQRFENVKFSEIYSSDLQRARNTAESILNRNRYRSSTPHIITDPRIREQNFGELEGSPWRIWHLKKLWNRTEPFPGGESAEQLLKRATEVLDEILEKFLYREKDNTKNDTVDNNEDESHVLIASHGLWITEFLRAISLRARITTKHGHLSNTSVTIVRVAPRPRAGADALIQQNPLSVFFICINDTSHLDEETTRVKKDKKEEGMMESVKNSTILKYFTRESDRPIAAATTIAGAINRPNVENGVKENED
ncbi:uncharacterized protein VTP21DRAFT_5783 [Calcarisporiella thermophila]|uniref:uncharacterized protein n=1 Tax=Calcarisporiella thermophila TaxID=911321 RepID=UPI0037446CF0